VEMLLCLIEEALLPAQGRYGRYGHCLAILVTWKIWNALECLITNMCRQ
jgi:hypothetical protein